MKRVISGFAIATCFFVAGGCSYPPKPFVERKIVIGNNETVKVPELNLSITNNGCGRKWVSDDGKPMYEKPFCGIVAKQKDSTITGGGDFKPIYVGNVEITIEKMNPWGVVEDSVPPGGCRVLIRKVDGR